VIVVDCDGEVGICLWSLVLAVDLSAERQRAFTTVLIC